MIESVPAGEAPTDSVGIKRQPQEPAPSQVSKRGRVRPVEKEWPEPIPDTPENIARALMAGPPKKQWRYLKRHRNRGR